MRTMLKSTDGWFTIARDETGLHYLCQYHSATSKYRRIHSAGYTFDELIALSAGIQWDSAVPYTINFFDAVDNPVVIMPQVEKQTFLARFSAFIAALFN